MNKFSFSAVACSILFTALVWAHGDNAHVMGTVTALGEDHVVVMTPKGKSVSLAFHPEIVFQQNGIHVEEVRPQVGDRLVAEVSNQGVPENRDWVATEISFVTPTKNP